MPRLGIIFLLLFISTNALGINVLSSFWKTEEYSGEVLQITAGANFTCALLANSRVKCWGAPSQGALGYGNTTQIGDNETPDSAGFVNVANTNSIQHIQAGLYHVCALFSGGGVKCWGRNQYGELSLNSVLYPKIGDNETPSSISTPYSNAKYVAAGEDHSCVIVSSGQIRCVGGGGGGDLGYGNGNNQNSFSSAGNINLSGKKAKDIDLGLDFTGAIMDDGTVYTWGGNGSGKLGLNSGGGGANSPQGPLNLGGDAFKISLGRDHACAILSDGKLRCWGDNAYGQLGYGNTNNIGDDEHPSAAGDVSLEESVIKISAGGYHTCAILANNKVKCWGRNDYG